MSIGDSKYDCFIFYNVKSIYQPMHNDLITKNENMVLQ